MEQFTHLTQPDSLSKKARPPLASAPVPVPAVPIHESPVRNVDGERFRGPCIRVGEQTPGVRGQSPRLNGGLVIPRLTTLCRDKVSTKGRADTPIGLRSLNAFSMVPPASRIRVTMVASTSGT